MTNKTQTTISAIDWQKITADLHEKEFALAPRLLPGEICDEFIKNYDKADTYRKTVIMEIHRFGLGEYKYFDYPLP